ncbi:MAG: DUF1573 domain-containing protein [Parabacteroides gordonii]|uniref:DUF1573 domain-containing protein n=1 Tax=Parabacteroides gordonii TaxID=574930 RepID=UPI003A8967CB
MLNIKRLCFILCCIFLFTANITAQNGAQISADELTYNFGTIAEADGLASHTFVVKNTGDSPLVITRITASCGCTQPEWTKAPIAPGKTGNVKVTYNPKGRPGPFYKTVSIFSNGKKGSYTLAIKGNVTPKPIQPAFIYPYSIGDLKLQTKTVLYSSIRPDETLGEKISVKNEGKTTLTIQQGKVPHFLTVEIRPTQLAPDEVGEITLLLDAKATKRKGRVTTEIPLTVESIGQKEISGKIHVAANIIDNFGKLSAAEKAQAPVAQLSGTLLDFGKLPERGGFIPLIGGKVTGTVDITNTGKSPLIIHSITCDNELVDISGGKKEIKPGVTATYKISVRPREIKTKLEALINVVCNDPNGPVRLIKVTAEK